MEIFNKIRSHNTKHKCQHTIINDINSNFENKVFGFRKHLYKVNESEEMVIIQLCNKHGAKGRVRVVTKDGGAQAGDDYISFDEIIDFNSG